MTDLDKPLETPITNALWEVKYRNGQIFSWTAPISRRKLDAMRSIEIELDQLRAENATLRAAEYIEELRAEKRPSISTEALIALKSVQHADADGVMARVSRQALDEAIAALSPSTTKICRADGQCQYAIDHGAERIGHCPDGECCMPEQREDYEAIGRAWCKNSSLEKWFPFTATELEYLKEQVHLLRQTNKASQVYRLAAEQKLQRVVDFLNDDAIAVKRQTIGEYRAALIRALADERQGT